MADDILKELADTIRARRLASADASYTRQLLDAGAERCARKMGEEAVETLIAGVAGTDEALKAEAADLIYHLLVLLEARGLGIGDVLQILQDRQGTSGLAEKSARPR